MTAVFSRDIRSVVDAGKLGRHPFPLTPFLLFVSLGPPVCGGRGRVEEKTDWTIVSG